MITREKLGKLSSEEKDELIMRLVGTKDEVIAAKDAYKKQVVAMVKFMQENDFINNLSMKDKDDKTWDRGKFIMDNLDKYIEKLHSLEQRLLPLTVEMAKPKRGARPGAISEFIDSAKKP